jgi:hypothetical protein
MRQGKATSCGCYKIEKSSTHGETHTRLYHIWKTMKQRCNYEKHINFKDYGGRGITICEDWSDFVNFRDWALSNGYRDNLTIERLDVNGNYEPDNCTWATVKMPFGKYKGEPISDLPDNYKQWMLDKFEWHAGNYNLREAIIMNM